MVRMLDSLGAQKGKSNLELAYSSGHEAYVYSSSLSRDGNYLVTGGLDNIVKLWDVKSGKMLRQFYGHSYSVIDVGISNDNNFIISCSPGDAAKIWDTTSGLLVRDIGGDDVECVTFSDDGSFFATSGSDNMIRGYDTATGGMLFAIKNGYTNPDKKFSSSPYRSTFSLAISPNGKLIAALKEDNPTKVWEISTGKEIYSFETAYKTTGDYSVSSITFLDNETIVYGTANNEIILQRLGKGTQSISIPSKYSMKMVLSSDKEYCATINSRGALHVIDLKTKEIIYDTLMARYTNTVDFVPGNSDHLIIGYGPNMKLLDWKKNEFIPRFSDEIDYISAFDASADGAMILLANQKESIQVMNTTDNEIKNVNVGHSVGEIILGSSKRNAYLIGNGVSSWDLQTLKQKWVIDSLGDGKYMRNLAVDESELYVAFSSLNYMYVVKNATGKIESFERWKGYKKELTFLPETGSLIAPPYIWNYQLSSKEKPAYQRDMSESYIRKVTNGERITFTSHKNGQLSIAYAENPEKNVKINAHLQDISEIVISESQHYFATGSGNGLSSIDPLIKIWDMSGKLIKTLEGHATGVEKLTWVAKDKFMLSKGFGEHDISLWDVSSGKKLASLVFSNNGRDWAVITPEGLFDATRDAMSSMYFVSQMNTIELSQLKDRFYEPGLLQKLLGYSKEPLRSTLGINNIELSPRIKLTHPHKNNGIMGITLIDQGGGYGAVNIKINGKEVIQDARKADLNLNADSITFDYSIEDHPFLKVAALNTIEVIAYNNAEYVASLPEKIYFNDTRKKEDVSDPKMYGIIVGTSDYNGTSIDLSYPAKDAISFGTTLSTAAANLLGAQNIEFITLTTNDSSNTSSKSNIRKAYKYVAEKAKPEDVIVLYFAGHGTNYGGPDGDFYYLSSDASNGDLKDPVIRQNSAISSAELTEWIKEIRALKQVLIFDACHSGQFAEDYIAQRELRNASEIRSLERLRDRTGMYILSGSAADAVSYEASIYGQGLLTYALLFGMKGASLRDNKYLDVSRLFQFAADKVPELAKDIGGMQKPEIRIPMGGESIDLGLIDDETREKITLPSPKPIFVRSVFQDEVTFDDHLNLMQQLDRELKEIQIIDESIVFIDVARFSGSYSIKGRYQLTGNDIILTANIIYDKQVVQSFKVSGKSNIEVLGRVKQEVSNYLKKSQG